MGTHPAPVPRAWRLLAAALAAFLLLPAVALASGNPSNGVHADPGSPAGKEYAIPLNSAGGGSNGSGGSLFGKGISPVTSGHGTSAPAGHSPATGGTVRQGATTGQGSATPRLTARPRAHRHRARRHRAAGAAISQPAAASTTTPGRPAIPAPAAALHPGGGSGIIWMGIAAAVVLVIGGIGAQASTGRARRRRTSPG
jgi:hypothetical protein